MAIKLNYLFLILTIILLITEVSIAFFLKDGFIRFTVGDYLATILVYSFFRSFLKLKPIYIAILTLSIAFCIEFMQLFNILDILELRDHTVIATILGNHFSIQDLVAYALGVLTIYSIDLYLLKNENN